MLAIEMLKPQRELIRRAIEGCTNADFFTVPGIRKNSIAWNLGHIVTVEQLLSYGLSGETPNLPEHYRTMFGPGTDPSGWQAEPDLEEIMNLFDTLPAQTLSDYHAGRFQNFNAYTTTTGVTLTTVEEAITFNNFHEGLHTGIIMAIRKELAVSA